MVRGWSGKKSLQIWREVRQGKTDEEILLKHTQPYWLTKDVDRIKTLIKRARWFEEMEIE